MIVSGGGIIVTSIWQRLWRQQAASMARRGGRQRGKNSVALKRSVISMAANARMAKQRLAKAKPAMAK